MFNLVPFAGAGRVATNRDGDPQLIGQLPQLKLPGSQTISVTPTRIRTNILGAGNPRVIQLALKYQF